MENYLGEIRLVGFNYAPQGWLVCDGSLQNISENSALFQLIGTTYGGDGQNTFALPDLRGRVPAHAGLAGGTTYTLGQALGSESVTLLAQQLGGHTHSLNTGPSGNANVPSGSTVLSDVGASTVPFVYGAANSLTTMAGQSIGAAGGSQSHENRQPYLVVNYIIATEGIYPSQS